MPAVVAGTVTGVALGTGIAHSFAASLFGISPISHAGIGLAVTLPIASAILAVGLPTFQLLRIDPSISLRE